MRCVFAAERYVARDEVAHSACAATCAEVSLHYAAAGAFFAAAARAITRVMLQAGAAAAARHAADAAAAAAIRVRHFTTPCRLPRQEQPSADAPLMLERAAYDMIAAHDADDASRRRHAASFRRRATTAVSLLFSLARRACAAASLMPTTTGRRMFPYFLMIHFADSSI